MATRKKKVKAKSKSSKKAAPKKKVAKKTVAAKKASAPKKKAKATPKPKPAARPKAQPKEGDIVSTQQMAIAEIVGDIEERMALDRLTATVE